MEKKELEEAIGGLEAQKNKLIERIRQLNGTVRFKQRQATQLEQVGVERTQPSAGRLRAQLEKIEFGIATAAYTPKMEKEMIKASREVEGKLRVAESEERVARKKKYVQDDLRFALEQQAQVEKQLAEIRPKLGTLYDRLFEIKRKGDGQAAAGKKSRHGRLNAEPGSQQGGMHRQKRQFRPDNEMQQYMQPHDRFVTIDEICIVKKKAGQA
ncbi:hypothetical protein FJZ26_01765 [Candidatus Parvarchaeota archaeon]|nr:hypothetical protein [Candidatus Parvarchaeota archaeon]